MLKLFFIVLSLYFGIVLYSMFAMYYPEIKAEQQQTTNEKVENGKNM